MAKKKGGFEQFWFADLRLAKSDKKAFEVWANKSDNEVWGLLSQVTHEGYKLSLRHDAENDTTIASLTCLDPGSVNYRGVMVSRASGEYESLMLGLYKHFEVADDCEWPQQSANGDWG